MSRRSPGEGSVQLRADGRWQGALQFNGRRRTVYGATRSEVARKLGELRQQARGGSLPSPGSRTVSDLLVAWLDAVSPTLKARTLADYRNLSQRYIEPEMGALRLSKVTPEVIQSLYASLQARSLERAPAHVHAVLHRAFALAVLWRWVAENPCDRLVKPVYHPPRKEVWTPDQLCSFLDGTRDGWLGPLWIVAATTGCRLGELLALGWGDVDLDRAALVVRRSVQRIDRKKVFSLPKTKAGDRTIALPGEAVAALKRQGAQQAAWRLKAGTDWRDHGLVFSGRKGNPMDHSVPEQAMRRECQRLELPRLTPHGLRHLAASLLLGSGIPVTAVSQRLGHASPSITMGIYAHALQHQDRMAADAMEGVLRGHQSLWA